MVVTSSDLAEAIPRIKGFRRRCAKEKHIKLESCSVSHTIALRIVRHGIKDTKHLSNKQLMLAIFLINSIAHNSKHEKKSAFDRKHELQKVLIKRNGITIRRGEGRFKDTIEISLDSRGRRKSGFFTHAPRDLVESWNISITFS
jgi:hypothetical protein